MSDNLRLFRLERLKLLGFIPKTILDIGAQKAHFALPVHQIWPDADIYLAEANRDHEAYLKSFKWAKKVKIVLLGDKKKSKVKYFASKNPDTGGNSIFREQTNYFDNCEIILLPMATLDSVVKEWGLGKIDLIKMDTQGSELNIIKGGEKILAKAEFVILELQNLEYNLGTPDAATVMNEMKKRGFTLYDITQTHYLPGGDMIQFDAIFINNNSPFLKRGKLW